MEYLSLEIFDREGNNSQFAVLPEGASITINDVSELFGNGDIWSFDFQLNIPANAHIFSTAGDTHGSRLHDQVDKRRARLWVEGNALFTGYLRLRDDADVDKSGNISISIENGRKTFSALVEGAKANQVPMMDDVLIGMALWRKRKIPWLRANLVAKETLDNGETRTVDIGHVDLENVDGDNPATPTPEYPRMVLPYGIFRNRQTEQNERIDCINITHPYDDAHPYCNATLCYQRYKYPKVAGEDDNEAEATRDVEVMWAKRMNSAPNFYVIYWLRCLMKHLNVSISENQMMEVDDLRRLFFVNTNCAYKDPGLTARTDCKYSFPKTGDGYYAYRKLVPEQFCPVSADATGYYGIIDASSPSESKINVDNVFDSGKWQNDGQPLANRTAFSVEVKNFSPWSWDHVKQYCYDNRYLHEAYASSECFPDVTVADVIAALESGFGVRLLFSNDYRKVRIVLLRNLFRNKEVQELRCNIVSDDGITDSSIRGFRMSYGDNKDDTNYYYKGFADKMSHESTIWPDTSDTHDYSHWSLNEKDYAALLDKTSAFNKTCYVTPITGNAYGVKVDKEGKLYDELHPALFEFAGFEDAEDGDCTGEEDTIHTVKVNFTPMIMNDINMAAEKKGKREQRFALLVEEKMEPRRLNYNDKNNREAFNDAYPNDASTFYSVDTLYSRIGLFGTADNPAHIPVKPGMFEMASEHPKNHVDYLVADFVERTRWVPKVGNMTSAWRQVSFRITSAVLCTGYRLYLQDNFEPNDDGVSPIETHNWGLTLGIMRGSGSDEKVVYEADGRDIYNSTWHIEPGSKAVVHPDTCDNYGNVFVHEDYTPGTSGYTGYEFGDKLLAGIGCQDQCDLGRTCRIFNTKDPNNYIRKDSYTNSGYSLITLCDKYYYATTATVTDKQNVKHTVWLTCVEGGAIQYADTIKDFVKALQYGYGREEVVSNYPEGTEEILERGAVFTKSSIIAVNPKGQIEIVKQACNYYLKGNDIVSPYEDDLVSLKLRAEKPNPFFDPSQPESDENKRYLDITNPLLRRRGLADKFYKEFSYWIRHARTKKFTVRMELSELLTIDKTKRVKVGDVTGFIKKMQYRISNKTGLGNVTLEIMYI